MHLKVMGDVNYLLYILKLNKYVGDLIAVLFFIPVLRFLKPKAFSPKVALAGKGTLM